ncbi:MAG: LytTR family DNA-binding domain-containing protein [Candidatus Cryptobacteroides sp.]|nr:LytTR family DNA-binding domain-containing protein [Candidatus Cryptobacteroides sp.]
MIRCIAIDDEPLALKQLESYINKVGFLELKAACNSAVDASKVLASQPADVLFCDINMPDLDGMSFVKSLASQPMVVFTTAYSEYAVEGFKVDAVDYLLKPFGFNDFEKAALKVKRLYDLENKEEVTLLDYDDSVYIKTDYKTVRVEVSSIIYIEGMSEYVKIITEDQKDPVIALLSMKKLEGKLPGNRFMRVHKSFIINLSKISQVSKGHVRMQDGSSIPIGESYRDSLLSYINSKSLVK